jgi:hypothetical protein
MTEHVKRGFHCDASWHLRWSGLASALYTKIGAITYDSTLSTNGVYYSSARQLAEFYNADESYVSATLRKLAKFGFLEVVGHGPGAVIEKDGIHRQVKKNVYKPKNYRYVTHTEWAAKHPGKCFVPQQQVWDGEDHDQLAQTLHRHSFGRTYWYLNMLAGARSSGLDDAEIVKAWIDRLVHLPKQPSGKKAWERVALTFAHDCKIGKVVREREAPLPT